MNKEIIFITGNQNKAREVGEITGFDILAKDLEIPEIQSLNIEEVAKAKASAAFALTGRPVMVDDTGMNIEALNGLPGALITWFLKKLGPEGILGLISICKNRKASVSTCIAYADANGVVSFIGTVKGVLADHPRGENGFGYDSIFIPSGQSKTYAEMTPEEKNEISMRRIALLKFKEFMGIEAS